VDPNPGTPQPRKLPEKSLRRVVCPGSFDPVTNGHLDVIHRMSVLFDEIVVAVGRNAGKNGLFSTGERVEMIHEVTKDLPNVTVEVFDGLLVDFCLERGIRVIVKGLRPVGDFDYELQMSQMNHQLAAVETLFVPTNPLYSFISSSLIKEVCSLGGDVSGLVPEPVLNRLVGRLRT
jgi:pantetheine-phosphate adenylyltransferase